jgi:hypothetical protein
MGIIRLAIIKTTAVSVLLLPSKQRGIIHLLLQYDKAALQ